MVSDQDMENAIKRRKIMTFFRRLFPAEKVANKE